MNVTPDLDIVQNGHAFEESDVLEGARDPQLGALMRLQGGDVAPVEEDLSVAGRVDAADAIEDAGLASTVGANDGEKITGMHLKADAGKGGHATKAQVQIVQPQQLHDGAPPPLGMLALTVAPRGVLSTTFSNVVSIKFGSSRDSRVCRRGLMAQEVAGLRSWRHAGRISQARLITGTYERHR